MRPIRTECPASARIRSRTCSAATTAGRDAVPGLQPRCARRRPQAPHPALHHLAVVCARCWPSGLSTIVVVLHIAGVGPGRASCPTAARRQREGRVDRWRSPLALTASMLANGGRQRRAWRATCGAVTPRDAARCVGVRGAAPTAPRRAGRRRASARWCAGSRSFLSDTRRVVPMLGGGGAWGHVEFHFAADVVAGGPTLPWLAAQRRRWRALRRP
jgi:hypothetical protein